MDKSFMAEVAAYARDNAWLQTFSEGYDSTCNALAQVERRNRKLFDIVTRLLEDATRGRGEFTLYVLKYGMKP